MQEQDSIRSTLIPGTARAGLPLPPVPGLVIVIKDWAGSTFGWALRSEDSSDCGDGSGYLSRRSDV